MTMIFRNNKRAIGVAAISGALLLSPFALQAQDHFSGPYVGGTIGLFSDLNSEVEWSYGDWNETVRFGVDDMFSRLDLRAGYGHLAANNVYFGVDFSYTVANGLDEEIFSYSDFGDSVKSSIEGDDGFAIKAQLGYALTPRSLLYGTVGYQQRNFELKNEWPGESFSNDEDFTGVGFGLGARFALTDNIHLNAEVFRVDYGSESWAVDGEREEWDPTETQFDLGLTYRFSL